MQDTHFGRCYTCNPDAVEFNLEADGQRVSRMWKLAMPGVDYEIRLKTEGSYCPKHAIKKLSVEAFKILKTLPDES